MGGVRPLVYLALVVLLAAAMAGCVSKKSEAQDEVLASWSRDKPTDKTSQVSISVPKDTDRLKFAVSTKPPKKEGSGWDWMDYQPCYYPPCESQESSTPSGHVSVTLWDPQNVEQGNVKLNYDSSESFVLHDPLPGTWTAKISYYSYDGPVALSAAQPAKVASGGLGGNFWDILGVVLALTTIIGGWFLYRRRGQFLSREMHRIDHTFSHLSDDVEECRINLLEMKEHLSFLLMRRKIEESQYLILEKRIDQYLRDLDTPGNRHGSESAVAPSPIDRFRRIRG